MVAAKLTNSNFFENVYDVVRLIPKGRVTSYGAIAAYLGSRQSARMVGWAMNQAHSDPTIPAHRVVNSKGLLTGKFHFKTPSTMAQLLKKEGVKIKGDQIINFTSFFWDPVKELFL